MMYGSDVFKKDVIELIQCELNLMGRGFIFVEGV
jgi:hypothetical protein